MNTVFGKLKQQHLMLSILITTVLYFIQTQFHLLEISTLNGQLDTVLQSLVSILGSLLGFIVSTVAILAAVLESPVFERLHRSDKTNDLLASFMSLIALTGITLALSLMAQFTKNITPPSLVLAFILICGLWWVFKFWYCMYLFSTVLNIRFNQSREKGGSPKIL